MSTLFELLPIGAYRSTESGRQLRANAALVRLNGYDSEAEMLAAVNDISLEWYVVAGRRDEFKQLMQRDGQVVNFVSEIYRHKSRELCWIREFAHVVRDTEGKVLYYEGTVEDITAEHAAEIALQASEKMLREITNEVPGMLYQMVYPPDVPGRYTFISSGIRELYHVESAAAMADSAVLRNMRHPEDRDRVNKVVVNAIQRRIPLSVEFRIILADGTTKWVHMASTPAGETAEGAVRHGVMTDITDHKNAQAELNKHEERWKLALDSTGDGVWDWHIQEGVEYYSQRYKEMYGYSQDKVWQTSDEYRDLVHPDDKEQLIHDQQAYFNGLKPTFTNERRVRCADGSWKWVLSRGMVISRDANGKPLRMIGTHTDISDRKSAEALIWSQANFDPLTGLPNRRMLRDRMLYAMRRQPESGQPVAVLFIDLDHFKEVNDALGHDSGDLLLVEAAHRIANCLGPQDTVARMGGDEFTVVLASAPQGPVLEQMLQNILGRLSAAFQLKTEQVFVSASIGVALFPRDATQVEDLFKHADQALYVAKGNGRNRYSFFTPELQEAAQTRLRMAADLRMALPAGQFALVYQPIVDLITGEVCKAEALLRWRHPQRGLVSPVDFIGIAETTGLIIDIGEWVFREAAAQAKIWRVKLAPDFQISVNKSPVQFQAPPQEAWRKVLERLELAGSSIAVEITEGLLMDATESVMGRLEGLREAGMTISLDDFGTGYSSLTYLQRFAIDNIKIDQSYVRNLHAGAPDLALCKAIITMAHELGMRVVAEGVETIAQCDLLINAGCDMGQGFLFAKPMSPAEFECFFSKHKPAQAAD